MTSAEGFGAAPTPWGAVQDAAWMALKDDRAPCAMPREVSAR